MDGFRKGMDLYFSRHDGTAVTVEDFRMAMEDANDVDLEQFDRWYSQVRRDGTNARKSCCRMLPDGGQH